MRRKQKCFNLILFFFKSKRFIVTLFKNFSFKKVLFMKLEYLCKILNIKYHLQRLRGRCSDKQSSNPSTIKSIFSQNFLIAKKIF